MKKNLKSDIPINAFAMDIKKCSGKLLLSTLSGDRFDLQSVLSRYVLAVIAKQGKLPADCALEYDEADAAYLTHYFAE